jgi:hypothetical protein
MAELSYAQVSALLKYDSETGKLYWLPRTPDMFPAETAFSGGQEAKAKNWNSRYAGKEAFTSVQNCGYVQGGILGRGYLAHRVAWLLVTGAWPKNQIDHINGDRTDNRIANLREVSNAENARNMSISSRNKSGVPGVFWDTKRGKWVANIGENSRTRHLGSFDDFNLAVEAREKAMTAKGFHPNHGVRPKTGRPIARLP